MLLLATAVYLFYLMMYQRNESLGWWAFAAVVMFIIAVNLYMKLQSKVKYHQTLLQINQDEIDFLNGSKTFDNGNEFSNPQHAYSYDLDLFCNNSVF